MAICARRLAVLLFAAVAWASTAGAQPADQAKLFSEATTREAALRREMATLRPASAAPTVRRVRTLVGAFDDLARIFPAGGQADKALWQGANLSADLFWQLGDGQDRDTALRLLATIVNAFPGGAFARQVPALERRLHAAHVSDTTVSTSARVPSGPAAPRTLSPAVAAAPASAAQPAPPASLATAPPATASLGTLAPGTSSPARTRTAPAKAPAAPVRATDPSPEATPEPAQSVSLTSVRRELLADAARITLELDREVSYRSERIQGPDRVFVDLPQTRPVPSLKGAVLPFPDDVVRRVRIGAQPGRVTRVVLDLDSSGRHSVYTLYNPYRIVIDVERMGMGGSPTLVPVPAPTPAPAPVATTTRPAVRAAVATPPVLAPLPRPEVSLARAGAPSGESGVTLPAPVTSSRPSPDRAGDRAAAAVAADIVASPETATEPDVARPAAPPPVAPAVNTRGGFSISRQLGLGIARIVIDAGHGGHDPGAKVKGLNEADLTLDVALRLEKLLAKLPGVEVVQTRRTNSYVALEERTEIANRSGADLFVSIHANASSDARARGVETYFLNFAPNAEAEAIAARENAGSSRQMRQLPDLVKAIALNNKIDESRDLAAMVQSALYTQVRKSDRRVRNLGVKQAPFMVLVGAAMPSILTEISFVTNQQEAGLLATDKYRQQIAEALLAGISRYQQSLKKASAVAAQ